MFQRNKKLMVLAGMINTDESALECDLAETYHIYDYRELPPLRVALFSVGLRENSRIKMKINNVKHSLETLILASIYDRVSFLAWSKTTDAQSGMNRPQLMAPRLLEQQENNDMLTFDSVEAFEEYRKRIIERRV